MKTIEIPAIPRVEGEGGLHLQVRDGKPIAVRLDIYEPPRFFEGFLLNRFIQEVPDLTARICGICPVAYQMSSALALEDALGIEVGPQTHALRRLMYCGEYVESHALHIFMLQAPDLYGKESIFELAAVEPDLARKALRLKKIGNQILTAIGGRSVHPVNVCVGGFYRWPDQAELNKLLPELQWGLETAIACVKWASSLPYPNLEMDYEFVALHHASEYGVMRGEIWSSRGPKLAVCDFENGYIEEHVQHSNALHGRTSTGGTYLVGPLARLSLNSQQLRPLARQALADAELPLPLRNPYKSLIARAIELVEFFDEAIALITSYAPQGPPHTRLVLRAGEGTGATEAPRGLLYHRYRIDENGLVQFAKITPPTAQNLPRIEADLLALAPELVALETPEASRRAEDLVRAYDPCISCATHFLRLTTEQID